MASSIALSYIETNLPTEDSKQAYHLLYPAYATYAGDNLSQYIVTSAAYPVYPGSILTGHVVGRVKATTLTETHSK